MCDTLSKILINTYKYEIISLLFFVIKEFQSNTLKLY